MIGVGASTVDNKRSCYSNEGILAAPGGNGVDLDNKPANNTLGPDGKPICLVPGQISSTPRQLPTATDPWTCEGDETLCVVSLVWRNSKPQFAYWVGTSFATPMVSGLAALAIEFQTAAANDGRDHPVWNHTCRPSRIDRPWHHQRRPVLPELTTGSARIPTQTRKDLSSEKGPFFWNSRSISH